MIFVETLPSSLTSDRLTWENWALLPAPATRRSCTTARREPWQASTQSRRRWLLTADSVKTMALLAAVWGIPWMIWPDIRGVLEVWAPVAITFTITITERCCQLKSTAPWARSGGRHQIRLAVAATTTTILNLSRREKYPCSDETRVRTTCRRRASTTSTIRSCSETE